MGNNTKIKNDNLNYSSVYFSYFIPLPKLTEDLHRVTVVKPTGTNMDDFNALAYIIRTFNVAEVRLREDYCLSDIQIYDLEGVKVDHLIKFTPITLKRALVVVEVK